MQQVVGETSTIVVLWEPMVFTKDKGKGFW
jgi:hypothetical protein